MQGAQPLVGGWRVSSIKETGGLEWSAAEWKIARFPPFAARACFTPRQTKNLPRAAGGLGLSGGS